MTPLAGMLDSLLSTTVSCVMHHHSAGGVVSPTLAGTPDAPACDDDAYQHALAPYSYKTAVGDQHGLLTAHLHETTACPPWLVRRCYPPPEARICTA